MSGGNNPVINFNRIKMSSDVAQQAKASSIRKSQPKSQHSIDEQIATGQSSRIMLISNLQSGENSSTTHNLHAAGQLIPQPLAKQRDSQQTYNTLQTVNSGGTRSRIKVKGLSGQGSGISPRI